MKKNGLFTASCMTLLIVIACNNPDKNAAQRSFIDAANIDSTVKPGDNFYKYVNGRWLQKAVIPSTETGVGGFFDIYNKTKARLKTILTEVADGRQQPGSLEQKVGDFYLSGMDSATIEKLGYSPVKPALSQIAAITNPQGVMSFAANQQTQFSNILFNQSFGADEKNSLMNIPVYTQGGLGMPDRDYYFKTDSNTLVIVSAYKTYIQKVFTLTGDDAATAFKKMTNIYALEKQLAGSHKTAVALRDPKANYNKFSVEKLTKKEPVLAWKTTLDAMGVKTDSVNVQQPAYFEKLNALLKTVPIDVWKDYLSFHLLENTSGALSSDFVNAKFAYTKVISGQQKIKDRWERMVQQTDRNLGEALGQLYVKKHFTEDAKKRMLELVNNLQIAFETRINNLDWMSDSTKATSKAKLHAFLKKIGFPDKWKDYSKVNIDKSTYYNNLVACSKNEYQFQLSKVGKPVDRTEWGMTPPTINAYYNPTFNEIVFPAGILQFPFFDMEADDAINYGGIGMVIGHEMTHGFDDQGALYDKDGNMKNWWTKDDFTKFQAKSEQVITLYNGFTIQDSIHLQGRLTTGENIADIGGIAIAYDAFKLTKQGKDTVKIDGLTPDQRFFVAFAQGWREKLKPETERLYANIDPHSPSMYRVGGPLMNFTPFYNAFHVQPGDKMYVDEADRIKIW